jgi:hypothetical protein
LKKYIFGILGILIIVTIACAELTFEKDQTSIITEKYSLSKEFKANWFDGKAELTSYKLKKARYGEIREGEAVMVFVTEPFLPNQQVKYEGHTTDEKAESILKLNFHQTFDTGVYPYSILTSVFTPLNPFKTAYKISTSTQEWCGHTFIQLNKRKNEYDVTSLSYFQKESDKKYGIKEAITEDELWTKIRINPEKLPIGNIKIIPGTSISRLNHFDLKVEEAKTELFGNDEIMSYKLSYNNIERSLKIEFETKSPHKILGWEESVLSGGKNLITTATINKSIDLDYWNKNSVADSTYKALLGL